MRVLHEQPAYATTESALDRLQAFLARQRSSREVADDMEGFELELHEYFMAAEREVLAEEMARLDVVARDEVRVRRGESPRDDYRLDFESGWSGKLVIMPDFFPRDRGWTARDQFPWFLGVAPIDYKSRLEAELRRHWGDFAKHGEHAAVDEVDGIEIDPSPCTGAYRKLEANRLSRRFDTLEPGCGDWREPHRSRGKARPGDIGESPV